MSSEPAVTSRAAMGSPADTASQTPAAKAAVTASQAEAANVTAATSQTVVTSQIVLTGEMTPNDVVAAASERRVAPARDLIVHSADVADAALSMAVRFHHGGKLLAFGIGSASTDAQHVAVEFVHPVIVGKRAFPAISLTTDIATQTAIAARAGMAEVFAHQLGMLAEPGDIALGISPDGNCPSVLAGLVAARGAGLLTVALVGRGGGAIAANSAADHLLIAGSADRRVIKEIHVTMYHLLWELVHLFIEQPSVLGQGEVRS